MPQPGAVLRYREFKVHIFRDDVDDHPRTRCGLCACGPHWSAPEDFPICRFCTERSLATRQPRDDDG